MKRTMEPEHQGLNGIVLEALATINIKTLKFKKS